MLDAVLSVEFDLIWADIGSLAFEFGLVVDHW